MIKHIILLGFKHVGKSTVGKHLGKKLQMPFIDLDDRIKENYHRQQGEALSCREIFHRHGETFFRDCETQALREVLRLSPAVIAVGGGTPLRPENQNLLKSHLLIYLTAEPRGDLSADDGPWHSCLFPRRTGSTGIFSAVMEST